MKKNTFTYTIRKKIRRAFHSIVLIFVEKINQKEFRE